MPVTNNTIGQFESWQVCVSQVAPGNTSAALETERATQYFSPDIALFVGIAGGVKDVKLGDVVAGSKIYGYESGADRDHFQPRPEVFLASYPLIQEAQIVARDSEWLHRIRIKESVGNPKVFVGPIAAGDKVIKSSTGAVTKLLKENYGDTLAVEMEGLGFMRAAHANKVDSMAIRGISDLLDGKAEADKSGSQEIAADNAAAFAFQLLSLLGSRSIAEVASQGPAVKLLRKSDDPSDFWSRFRELAPRLYPRGPDEDAVWTEAGGDLSRLNLSGNGRSQWSRALRLLENGGGGEISPKSLIEGMLKAYGRNYELQYLRTLVERV
ncbi:5'-methylthioadenosine/S-adenosylhomocysteine nucleosidase [Acidobacterium sp. S8]|uniref:5'-methylthioadenosine/S-adenosylhomocysteine nucleosidase n=1 Tax=Acidobacterium sp. S8 TaxID=1641854 RepID=UPI00131EAF87|nr:5'-methylthioadenosine/S-adenosylhomocysteine nucleosidase [Acidobacterium sp. S8]